MDSFGNVYIRQCNTGNEIKINMDAFNGTVGEASILSDIGGSTPCDGVSGAFTVEMEKTVSPTTADQGDTVTYTYRISNPNSVALSGLTFTDNMADSRTFNAGTLSTNLGGTENAYAGTNLLQITNFTLPAATISTITVDVTIGAGLVGDIFNQATITGLDTAYMNIGRPGHIDTVESDFPGTNAYRDPTPLNVLPAPQIDVSKTANSVAYDPTIGAMGGYNVDYIITATNTGQVAGEYDFTDTPTAPAGMSVTSVIITAGANASTTPTNGVSSASVTDEPIAIAGDPGDTDTWNVTVQYTITDLSSVVAGPASCNETTGVGGFANTVSADPDSDNTNNDACMDVEAGNITGTVWLDTDGDGVEDIGESGIGAVTVHLCSSPVTAAPCDPSDPEYFSSTVSDASGDYNFPGLPAGNYVTQIDPVELDPGNELDGLEPSPSNAAGTSNVIMLSLGGTEEVDFGYVPDIGEAVIEGTVWADVNGDGVRGPGEVGIEGVSVDLWEDTDGDGIVDTIVGTATTGPDGSYQVTDITFTGDELTDGRELVAIVDQTDPELVAFCNPTAVAACGSTPAQSTPITVLPNDVVSDVDFGFDTDSVFTVQDRIWNDENGDGVFDVTEQGVGGVTVDLLDSNGNVVASTATNPDGMFSFEGLTAGDYEIQISDNSGELNGLTETTGTGGSALITVNGASTGADGILDTVGDDGTPTFGFNAPGTISGTIFSDPDSSGTLDTDESGIAVDAVGDPIIVELRDGNCTPGVDCPTTTVNPDGSYEFTAVPPGDYTVVVTNPPAGTSTTGGNTQNVTIGTGESAANIDFGYNDPALSDISGTVFQDVDTDGTNEPDGNDGNPLTSDDNEMGLGGVTIELRDIDGNVIAMTTTNPDGTYTFANVPGGDYIVAVTDTGDVLNGYELTSGLDQRPVTAASGTDIGGVDFGYVDEEQTAAITSGLWIDTNGDGVRDPGELPISGVLIHLCESPIAAPNCDPADPEYIGSAETDANGEVIFPDLPAGTYEMDVDTTDPDFPSDLVETSYTGVDPNAPISLSEGETYDADFGYVPAAGNTVLSGTLWSDADSNGLQDGGEVGIGGVAVVVRDSDGAIVATATTNPDGTWDANVTPDAGGTDYYVTYEQAQIPTGLNAAEPTNLTDADGDGEIDTQYVLTGVMPDQVLTDLDFGFNSTNPASPAVGEVTGTIYLDIDASGDNESEPGIESVTMNLVDSNDNVVATVMTSDGFTDVDGDGVIDPAGYYSFEGVLPGDYTVEVSDTNNSTIGLNPTENASGSVPVTVAAGAEEEVDFGYAPEQGLGSIGNLIWLDIVNDGIFNSEDGDVGLAGVTVECWFDTDGDDTFAIGGEDNLIRKVETDVNGEYLCEAVPTGGYHVRVTDEHGVLAGFSPGPVIGGTDDNTNKMQIIDALGIPTMDAYYLDTASSNYTADFSVAGNVTLNGTVYDNTPTAGDGTYNNGTDTPVAGVSVTLYKVESDGTLTPLVTAVTDVNGFYEFTGAPAGVDLQIIPDASGTSVNGYTETENNGGSPVINVPTGTTLTNNFGYEQPPVVTNPVTLGYFHAEMGVNKGEITFRWQTVTESGNVGFNLYGKANGEAWQKLNAELIPSPVGDSLEVQHYEYLSVGPVVTRFAIGDVDVFGKETIRGPFKLGKKHGVDRSGRTKTDWKKIREQNKMKKAARKAEREQRRAKRMKRLEQKLDSGERQMRRDLKRKQHLERTLNRNLSLNDAANINKPNMHHAEQAAEISNNQWQSRLIGAVMAFLVPSAHALDMVEPVADPGLIYLQTDESGIYRVTYEQLLEQGIDLTGIKHWRLALTHRGEKVGVRSKGQDHADRTQRKYFGPGGWIEFIADGQETLYTKSSIYALYNDSKKRLTIQAYNANPNSISTPLTREYMAKIIAENDIKYSPATSVGDPWYATRTVSTSQPKTQVLQIDVDHILSGSVTVSTDVWGGFAGQHNVSVQLNDYAIGSAVFNGFTAQTISGQTTHAALIDGQNHIKVTVTNTPGQIADVVHTDKWSIIYPRKLTVNSDSDQLIFSSQAARFQVSGYTEFVRGNANRRVYRRSEDGQVKWLSKVLMPRDGVGRGLRFIGDTSLNATYYVSHVYGLRQVKFVDPVEQEDLLTGKAQYLVISHPDFMDGAMDQLVEARQAQGYTTKVVDVEAVYTAFDYGYFGADAIQKYIRWAHQNLDTEVVLLVGGDTHDYHGNLANGSMSFIPSMYVQTSDRIYYAPSDGKYADVDGDNIPDLSIGRMIPRTTAEWANIVAKTLQYSSHPNPRSLALAVDEQDIAAGYSFSADADATIAELPQDWQDNITRAYIDELGVSGARTTLIDALNEGQAVAGMFGHSGIKDWTFAGLFKAGDAAKLTNAGAPTVITQWGCWNTYYVSATEDSLAHEFMLNDLNGAAAVLGASTLTEADHERELALEVYPRMFETGKPIGQAILEAKIAHAQEHADELDVILGWNLLGDPALIVEGG